MSAVLALLWPAFIVGTIMALIRMNRATCLPCSTADDSAYCNPPRPRRPN